MVVIDDLGSRVEDGSVRQSENVDFSYSCFVTAMPRLWQRKDGGASVSHQSLLSGM